MSGGDTSGADTLQGGERIGEVLGGKYRLERLLGRGGMGEVYEARHVVVGRRFAIKFLHTGTAPSGGAAARFLREAQAAGSLESPHLAAVLDFDRAADGAPFLVMEFLQGESLARALKRERRLPLPRVVALCLQACAGLGVAHRAGIVHRDLKPDNLFLVQRADGAELLKIVDFGIAKLLDDTAGGDVTQSGAVLGTPFYMAPEQARGERGVDQRVDVHALGVIAYELLSGRKPHPGDSYNAILAHILTEPPEPLARLCPELPKALVAAIERAMAFDPAARFASVDAFASELSRFVGREVSLRGEAVDLAAPGRPSSTETRADITEAGESPGTLQTAVGDVSSSERRAPGIAVWLALAAVTIGAAAYVFAGRLAGAPLAVPSADSQPNSAAAPAVAAAPLPVASVASVASVTSPAAPPSGASVTAVKPIKRGAEIRSGAVRPPAAASFQPPASPSVTFDEKNPY